MATYTINGGNILKVTRSNGDIYWLPNPNGMEVAIQDIDSASTGRSTTGLMFRDRVATKRKLNCTFPPLYSSDMALTLQAIQDQFFTLTYPDPMTGASKTITAYVGDRTTPAYHINYATGVVLYESLSANFVER